MMTQSVNPLGEVVAGLQLGLDLGRVHGLVFRQVLGILPLEELDAIFRFWLASKVAVSSSLLVLWLSQCQRHSNASRTAVKVDLDNVCDIVWCQAALLGAICLDKEGKWLGNPGEGVLEESGR